MTMALPFRPRPAIALADAAHAALAERVARFRHARDRFLDAPDPDPLHDVRVALRRLRAARRLFRPDIRLPRGPRDRDLRRIGRRLADLRDLDIVLGAVEAGGARIGRPAAELARGLTRARARAVEKARARLDAGRVRDALGALEAWVEAPRLRVAPDALVHDALPARLRETAALVLDDPAWAFDLEQDRTGALRDDGRDTDAATLGDALHRLRRRAKRLRYQLETGAPLLGLDERAAVAALTDVQDVLGELQDVRVIEAWRDELDADEGRPGEEFDEWLVGRRQAALARWRRLREHRLAAVSALLEEAPDADG
jgi:CHAD domain-containing protein